MPARVGHLPNDRLRVVHLGIHPELVAGKRPEGLPRIRSHAGTHNVATFKPGQERQDRIGKVQAVEVRSAERASSQPVQWHRRKLDNRPRRRLPCCVVSWHVQAKAAIVHATSEVPANRPVVVVRAVPPTSAPVQQLHQRLHVRRAPRPRPELVSLNAWQVDHRALARRNVGEGPGKHGADPDCRPGPGRRVVRPKAQRREARLQDGRPELVPLASVVGP